MTPLTCVHCLTCTYSCVILLISLPNCAHTAEGPKDTKPEDVMKVTYVPSLTTFEEDINELYPPQHATASQTYSGHSRQHDMSITA